MKLLICSIWDGAVGAFGTPFFSRSKSEAIRSFSDAVGKSDTPFAMHPEDYTLFCLAAFDDQTGEIMPASANEKLISAKECVAAANS